MSTALREGVQRLEVTLRVTLAVLLRFFTKNELLNLKLATDAGAPAVAETAKKKG